MQKITKLRFQCVFDGNIWTLDKSNDLQLFWFRISHFGSSPAASLLFWVSEVHASVWPQPPSDYVPLFSNWWLYQIVARRAVSPTNCFFPTPMKSFTNCNTGSQRFPRDGKGWRSSLHRDDYLKLSRSTLPLKFLACLARNLFDASIHRPIQSCLRDHPVSFQRIR